MVTIDSGRIEASNKFREVPRSKWESLVQVKRDFLFVNINYDCRCLIEFCEEAEEVYAELGYASSEEMIREGYELDPSQIELAVAWLNTNGMDRPVPLAEAIAKVEAMPELPEHGEIGKGRVRGDNVTSTERGNATEYTLRRLKRDAPELLEAIKRGELSVNAAAILESRKGYRSTQRETVPEPSEPGRGKVKPGHDDHKLSLETAKRLRAINRAPEIVGKLYDQGLVSQVDAAFTSSPPTRNAQQAR
jgi:hypothetical protein